MPAYARPLTIAAVCLGVIALAGGCGSTQTVADDTRQIRVVSGSPVAGMDRFYRAGDLLIAPQPTEDQLRELTSPTNSRPVRTVINLRSTSEVANTERVGYDQPAFMAQELPNVRYVHIPLGGDDGYEPADVEAFASAIESSEGRVLVHCASGGRARSMWQAYLIEHRGYSPARAERVAETLGQGRSSLERLLDRDLVPRG